MSKLIRNTRRKFTRMERGQVLVVVALAAVGIIAIVGLVMDVGIMFIGNARLRRAVDAAALSAALQYRQGFDIDKLTSAANEFLVLNGINNPNSTVSICDEVHPDPTLCTEPLRKLVRVSATGDVHLAFLPVIGINTVHIAAVATSETASLDVVLVIDRSESMTYGVDLANPIPYNDSSKMSDPSWCNYHDSDGNPRTYSSCEPFKHVVDAAANFVESTGLLFPYDRVAVVTFDQEPHVILHLDDNCPTALAPCTAAEIKQTIEDTLKGLTVFEGAGTDGLYINGGNPSRAYGDDNKQPPAVIAGVYNYWGLQCPVWDNGGSIAPCTTTNIGAALQVAGNEFAGDSRQQALWVVILLTDGMANAGHSIETTPLTYYCPDDTWDGVDINLQPFCNDGNPAADATRPPRPIVPRPAAPSPHYDASDYAYDMADFVGKPASEGGQYALIYTIGLGPTVDRYPQSSYVDPYNTDLIKYPNSRNEGLGRIFLNYASHVGRGQSFYASAPADLDEVFRLIGNNIATRLAH